MCELLGLSANVPADICFSFSGLMQRGGATGRHKDGWGIAFYEGNACRLIVEPHASSKSRLAQFVKTYPFHSEIIISHIRRATYGKVALENTHPFVRELWGKPWAFAHNGNLPKIKQGLKLKFNKPIGNTDSEYAFCWMLDELRKNFSKLPDIKKRAKFIANLCFKIRKFGVFNLLLSEGDYLYAFCASKLHYLQRQAPFGKAILKDADLELDIDAVSNHQDKFAIIATQPLTINENWQKISKDTFLVFSKGELLLKLQNC